MAAKFRTKGRGCVCSSSTPSSSNLAVCCAGTPWPSELQVVTTPDPTDFGNPGINGTLIPADTGNVCDDQLNGNLTPSYLLDGVLGLNNTRYFCVRTTNKFSGYEQTLGELGETICTLKWELTILSCSPFHAIGEYEYGGTVYTVEITE